MEIASTGTKICTHCHAEKPYSEFYRDAGNSTGFSCWCKECSLEYARLRRLGPEGDNMRARDRAHRQEHRDEINARNRERYAQNLERYRGYKKKWRDAHYEDYLRQAKEQRLKHIDRVRAYKKRYEQENKDKKKKWDKKYRDTHHEHRNEYNRIRKENDPIFRLKHQVGGLILQAFKKGGYSKPCKTAQILGCDYETLYKHLTDTWRANYGTEWNGEPYNIDHIVPLATAKSEEDIIRLCHYTNLQLLTPEDNLDKRAKLDWKLSK